jgi:hypothetical protein
MRENGKGKEEKYTTEQDMICTKSRSRLREEKEIPGVLISNR